MTEKWFWFLAAWAVFTCQQVEGGQRKSAFLSPFFPRRRRLEITQVHGPWRYSSYPPGKWSPSEISVLFIQLELSFGKTSTVNCAKQNLCFSSLHSSNPFHYLWSNSSLPRGDHCLGKGPSQWGKKKKKKRRKNCGPVNKCQLKQAPPLRGFQWWHVRFSTWWWNYFTLFL